MITRRMKVQLIVFTLIAVLGVVYAGAQYAGLGRLFGVHGYQVKVELADSGGIFSNADVTYRGVTVGRVGGLHVSDTGVEVDLDLDPSGPAIPASARAVVADRSAVGEQYIDLEPTNANGPFLTDGSVISVNQTALPIAPQTLLSDLDQLSRSVPIGSLRTVVDQLGTAFAGAGPELRKFLDAASSLTDTALAHLPQTTGLLSAGHTVLASQQAEASQITSFASSVNEFAAQLRTSDPDIRQVITALPQVATQVDDLLRVSGSDLGVVLANLLTTARVTQTRTRALSQLLVEFPYAVAAQPSTNPSGVPHLGFVFDLFDPMPCTAGYQGTKERPGDDTTPAAPNNQAYCALPAQTGVEVRGSNNAPFGGMPTPAGSPAGSAGGGPHPTTLGSLLGLGG